MPADRREGIGPRAPLIGAAIAWIGLLAGVLVAGILVAGILAAATDHSRHIKCPPGWKPNTGYLQHGCVPR